MTNRDFVYVGLRDQSPEQVKDLIKKYENEGYAVTHMTKGLPKNGVLKCIKRSLQ